MRSLILLITLIAIFTSCKENIIDGYTSVSVKQDVVNALDKSEWIANSDKAYYSKIVFDKDIIEATVMSGEVKRMSFHVSNITSPTVVLPEYIQLRLKSDLYLNEIYLKNDYSTLESVIRTDVNSTYTSNSFYTKK